jgi:hypothetical protein
MGKIKYWSLVLLLMMTTGLVSAQTKSLQNTWQFRSFNTIGLLEGQAGSAFQLQTVNGAQYNSWFAGLGLGLDYYRYRTIPLFLDLRKEFGKTVNKLFVYADMGIGFSWLTDQQKNIYYSDDHYGNGLYNDLGIGYKLSVGKNSGLLISLGYSYKKLTETYPNYYNQTYWNGTMNINPQTQQINYSLNRLSIKVGWQF